MLLRNLASKTTERKLAFQAFNACCERSIAFDTALAAIATFYPITEVDRELNHHVEQAFYRKYLALAIPN